MCNQKHPLFSVIIPIYNAERYIEKCLDSLLEQDIEKDDLEIICINDGSTDHSLYILQDYAERYDNIVVIDKNNSGVSATRNIGLEKAGGEYIWFIDADDWIAKNCFGSLKEIIIQENPTCVLLQYREVYENSNEATKAYYFDKKALKTKIGVPFYVCAVCMAIAKKDLIDRNSLRFIEHIAYGEDTIFMRDILDYIDIENQQEQANNKKIAITNPDIYFYRKGAVSATSTAWTTNRLKYMDSLLSRARLDVERSALKNKPSWYTEQYKRFIEDRIVDYMLFWLPGSGIDLNEALRDLKSEGFYPLKKSSPQRVLGKASGIKNILRKWYQVISLKYPLVYRLYFKQMTKKYNSIGTGNHIR